MKSKRHTKRHKKTHKKIHRKYTRRHLYRKRREIVSLPGSKGLPFFSASDVKKNTQIHIVTNNNISGNMIPGLRNM